MEMVKSLNAARLEGWLNFLKVQRESFNALWLDMILSPTLERVVQTGKVTSIEEEMEITREIRFLLSLANLHWTDLPYQNGQGVYKESLHPTKLLRALLLINYLIRTGWPLSRIEKMMGFEGGGQIALDPSQHYIDRLITKREKVNALIQAINVGNNEGTFPRNALGIMEQEYDRLLNDPKAQGERIFLAYRWFKNEEGKLPPLHPEMEDHPIRSALEKFL